MANKLSQLFVTSFTLVLFAFNAQAMLMPTTTIQYGDLPTQINNQFSFNGCVNDCVQETGNTLTSETDLSYMNAFTIGRDGLENWLIRYALDFGSSTSSLEYDVDTGGYETILAPHSGYIWLEAPKSIDINNTNIFRIYTDQVVPDPDYLDDSLYQSTWIFGMDANDVNSGGASITSYGSDGGEPPLPGEGSLELLRFLSPCIECDQSVALNLVGLSYLNGSSQLIVDPSDTNPILLAYSEIASAYDVNNSSNFYVQPVPVPAAIWLFGSGLFCLIGAARIKKRMHNLWARE